jgi:hypothetical protein
LKVFKDEYLLDFIAGDELDDERGIEQSVVLNITITNTKSSLTLLSFCVFALLFFIVILK